MAIKDLLPFNSGAKHIPVKRHNDYSITPYREPGSLSGWADRDDWFNSAFGPSLGLAPFRELEERFDRLFDSFMQLGDWNQGWNKNWSTFVPAIDVNETDKEVVITAELPGMDEKDIEISVSQDMLTLSGEKKAAHENKGKDYYKVERSYGTFQRSIPLPQGLDLDHVDAIFKKGLLTITVPRLADAQLGIKHIPVKVEGK